MNAKMPQNTAASLLKSFEPSKGGLFRLMKGTWQQLASTNQAPSSQHSSWLKLGQLPKREYSCSGRIFPTRQENRIQKTRLPRRISRSKLPSGTIAPAVLQISPTQSKEQPGFSGPESLLPAQAWAHGRQRPPPAKHEKS